MRAWGTENGKDLQDYKHQQRREEVEVKQELPTLKQAADEYLENSRHRPSTKKDYTNCIYNQVLPGLGAATPLESFTWGTGGRTGERAGGSSWTGRRALRSEHPFSPIRH